MKTRLINFLLISGIILIACLAYHATFSPFFNPENGIGHDYSLALPSYLDGYYWYLNNGFLNPPWFTPAFCAGQPFFADPQSVFYSPTQFLTFLVDPLTASYWTLILFSVVGFGGMFAFCRTRLACDAFPALVASMLWVFNGFTTHHHLVGHVGFVPVLLAPVFACLLIPPNGHSPSIYSALARAGASGLMLAGCLHAGLGSLMLPFGLSIWGLACLAALRGHRVTHFYAMGLGAGVIALGIVATKIAVAAAVMQHFPRTQYLLPGMTSFQNIAEFVIKLMFNPEENVYSGVVGYLVNRNVSAGPHELAFDLTPIPALIIGFALLMAIPAARKISLSKMQMLHLGLLVSIILAPLALLFYSPEWNAILKSLPVVSSTSAPWRWLIIFLPLLCSGTAIAMQSLLATPKDRKIFAMAIILFLLVFKITTPRAFYERQGYDADNILVAYQNSKAVGFHPAISKLGAYVNENNEPISTGHQNDLIAGGVGQVFCYNPLFGYSLENFSSEGLHPGDPLKVRAGKLNLKNPACYVFPEENHCSPGDLFEAKDVEKAKRFLNYQPWEFEKSSRQKIADAMSLASIMLAIILIGLGLLRRGR